MFQYQLKRQSESPIWTLLRFAEFASIEEKQ